MVRFLAAFILILSSLGWAEDSEKKSTYVMCKNGIAVRTIRIELKGMACRAYYTKQGVDQEVGKSGSPDLCYEITDKIRKNLEAASWKCKDISQARVSAAAE